MPLPNPSETVMNRRREIDQAKTRRLRNLSQAMRRELTTDERERAERQIERARERMDQMNLV